MLDLFPDASVFYLGLFREKVSLQPVEYVRPFSFTTGTGRRDEELTQRRDEQYQKLPKTVTVDTLFLLDPLIATGGTAIAAISILVRPGSSLAARARARASLARHAPSPSLG